MFRVPVLSQYAIQVLKAVVHFTRAHVSYCNKAYILISSHVHAYMYIMMPHLKRSTFVYYRFYNKAEFN